MNKDVKYTPIKDEKTPKKPPNDAGIISVQGHVKIFDPNSKQKFVDQKG